MNDKDIIDFPPLNTELKFIDSPAYTEEQLEMLNDAAVSLVSRISDTDKLFDVMLEINIYLCLMELKQRDTVFFERLRSHDNSRDHIPAAHEAKKFILEDCRGFPFNFGTVLNEADVILGSLICEATHNDYSIENMCTAPVLVELETMGFPDSQILSHTRKTAQSIFHNWDNDDKLIYSDRSFAALVSLYLKYRFAYDTETAVRMIYGIAGALEMTENDDFFGLVYKVISLVDGVCSCERAKMYRPAAVLWHIFRVLRRMSEGIACDEWMKCGCHIECQDCDCQFSPDREEN